MRHGSNDAARPKAGLAEDAEHRPAGQLRRVDVTGLLRPGQELILTYCGAEYRLRRRPDGSLFLTG